MLGLGFWGCDTLIGTQDRTRNCTVGTSVLCRVQHEEDWNCMDTVDLVDTTLRGWTQSGQGELWIWDTSGIGWVLEIFRVRHRNDL